MKDQKPISIKDIKNVNLMEIYNEILTFVEYPKELTDKIDKDFFESPASSKFHCACYQGLLLHSINTAILSYKNLLFIRRNKNMEYINKLNEEEFLQYSKETVLASLFHDYCKVNNYIPEQELTEKQIYKIQVECQKRNINSEKYIDKLGKTSGSCFIDKILNGAKEEELNEIKPLYEKDKKIIDLGHGETSIIKLQDLGFKLTNHQLLAIRYHQNSLDVEWNLPERRKVILDYQKEVPMLRCLILADLITGTLYE